MPCPCFAAAFAAALANKNHTFCFYQQSKSSASIFEFRQAINCWKMVLEAARLAYANKTKESITFQKLGSQNCWRIANSVFNKSQSAIPPLFNYPKVFYCASGKAKLLDENFSKNSYLDG